MAKDKLIEKDRMRFKKDSMSANFALLGLVFGVFYFVLLFRQNDNFYYTIRMGVSVIYNLVFMLAVFLSSEEIKNYNRTFSYVLLVLGIMQIVRIFYFPALAYGANTTDTTPEVIVMSAAVRTRLTIYLVLSAVCLIVSAVNGFIRSTIIANYRADLASGKIVLEKMTSEDLVSERKANTTGNVAPANEKKED